MNRHPVPMKRFPVLGTYPPKCPTQIPWAFIAPHEKQAQRNHSQHLKVLAEHGGLDPHEIVCVVTSQPRPQTLVEAGSREMDQAIDRLLTLLASWHKEQMRV